MTNPEHATKRLSPLAARLGVAVGLLVLGLSTAAPAFAGYEHVATFADSSGNKQLLGAGGLALNTTGAGGVPAGTMYAVSGGTGSTSERIIRYNAKGEFRAAWGWNVADRLAGEFQRCGPDGDPAFPTCRVDEGSGGGGDAPDSIVKPQAVAVDQTTGYVYVRRSTSGISQGVIKVFSADGSQLIASFGEVGAEGESFDQSPEKIRNAAGSASSSIAVDSDGTLYVTDLKAAGSNVSRIMVFRPQTPGDYEHYVYTGRSNDIEVGSGLLIQVAVDSADNIYASWNEAIYKFSAGDTTAPVCEYDVPDQAVGMTVNPESGEIFYFSEKNRKIHQLGACDSQGEFEEVDTLAVTPKTLAVYAMTVNPSLAYEAGRPDGILYVADSEERLDFPQAGESRKGIGHIFASAVVNDPVVESQSFSSVTTSTATLGAQINPKGSTASYVFQYITAAAYEANDPVERFAGASEAPLGGAILGSGQSPLSAAASLVGLQPDTEYRFRVLAASNCEPDNPTEVCEAVGSPQAFRTYPAEAPGLPDARAWELVSPAQKHGGEVFPLEPSTASCGTECKPGTFRDSFPMQSSLDGDAVVYEGFPFSFSEGSAVFNQYLSRRTASGWQTTILSPLLQSLTSGYRAFDADLTLGLLYQVDPSLTPQAPSEYANLYLRPTANSAALTALLESAPPNRSPGHGTDALKLTHAGASADFSHQLFEANDALTAATPFTPEATDPGATGSNLYESVGDELRLVNVLPGNATTVPGAKFGSGTQLKSGNQNGFSSDFSHAISADGSRVFWSDPAGQVYVREDGESTFEIPDSGKFLTASEDGSQVLLANGHLYDLESEATTDLTAGLGGFQGIAGQSDDLSHVYFVDTAVLSGEEENDQGAKAQATEPNLYAWHEGATTFVATLHPSDNSGINANFGGDWQASPAVRSAEASPDGRWLAFRSREPLTGYDSTEPGKATCGGHDTAGDPCNEVFLYDSASGKLSCPSCNSTGTRPLGGSSLGLIRGAESSTPQPRYLTDSGRLYFDSRDSLSAFDSNDGVEDVYQYEPQGIGSCKREGGCVKLISAGHEPFDSNFLSTDLEGRSVFFTARDQLVLKDRDDLVDLYVAREGGGIGAETETARSECQGEACQPAAVVPTDPTPGSSTFSGAGNVVEKKATHKKHKKKHRQAKKKRRHRRSHGRAANHNRGGVK